MLPPADEPGDLPRSQAGANPQHVMATLLGDYWLEREEHLPSAGLVDLVCEFDVTVASARAALSRLLRRGTLAARKSGRHTFYRLSEPARAVLRTSAAELAASTSPGRPPWDGSWLVVAFSVSEDRREVRHALRAGLRRAGFGPLYDGVWASPTATEQAAVALLDGLDVDQATVLRSSVVHPQAGPGHPRGAWDLDAAAGLLRDFCTRYRPVLDRLEAGEVGPAAALRHRTEAVEAWRHVVGLEPSLPSDLLPAGWPREEATDLFVRLVDGLAPLAEQRFGEVVAREAPALAHLASTPRLGATARV